MSFLIGTAKVDITPDHILGVIMMGWGDPHHDIRGIASRIHARVIAVTDPSTRKRIVLVSMELCFITDYLRTEILRRTGLQQEELIITANHTHSAPGGFSNYVFYSLTNDGFVPQVFECYASRVSAAIQQALAHPVEGNIRFGRDSFSDAAPVAFNRSIRAYNRNPEVTKRTRRERHLAVDREMTLIRFDDLEGRPLALWSWFAVHGTSIHKNHHLIHPDNKGVAASVMEASMREKGASNFVAVFAQGAGGDVSPNFKYYLGLMEKRGQFRDDFKSCEFNANLQVNLAQRIYDSIADEAPLPQELNSVFMYGDLSSVHVDTDLVEGKRVRTGPAEVGLSQFGGTSEGRGASVVQRIIIRIVYGFIRWIYREHFNTEVQGNKFTVIEAGESMLFGTKKIDRLPIPDWVNPLVATFKRWARQGILQGRSFIPQVLPLQIIRLGNLVIPVTPGEFTTISGLRLRRLLENEFCREKQLTVLFQGYSNEFCGYTATPEEYDQQGYEGGSTFYGKWTLPAYLTLYRRLARKLFDENEVLPDCSPPVASQHFMKVLTDD